jgi:hypothetical protein
VPPGELFEPTVVDPAVSFHERQQEPYLGMAEIAVAAYAT